MKANQDSLAVEIFVSESVLSDDHFGVYAVDDDDPEVQIYLSGGYANVAEATQAAHANIERIRGESIQSPDEYVVEYRERSSIELKGTYSILDKDALVEAVTSHIGKWDVKLTKKTVLKGLLSYGNIIFYGTAIVLWIYWTGGTVTVPALDLPVVGKSLSGKVLDRNLLATYYPVGLFVLFTASFFKTLGRNLANDELRRKVVLLVKEHGWRLIDFAKAFQLSLNKGANPWFSGLIRWASSNDPSSLTNLLKLRKIHIDKSIDSDSDSTGYKETELQDTLKRWSWSEFDQRFHNLLYLDRSKYFRSGFMCFDPVVYLIMNNRTIFRLYSFLKSQGCQVDELNAPTDPYLVGRMEPYAYWFGVAFSISLLGWACLWSLVIAHTSIGWTVLGATLSIASLVLPNLWNYMAVMKRRGFPGAEPIGAYTVGQYAVNKLSLIGS